MWKILVFFCLIGTSVNAKEFHGYYVSLIIGVPLGLTQQK